MFCLVFFVYKVMNCICVYFCRYIKFCFFIFSDIFLICVGFLMILNIIFIFMELEKNIVKFLGILNN